MLPASNSAVHEVGARLDRLPVSSWHRRTLGLVGVCTFFDAYDALAIAFVLPVLLTAWDLRPQQIGGIIAIGYLGQLIGAVALGAAAERFGRLNGLRWAVAIMSLMSVACAFVWSVPALMVARLLQGIGLGGEVPIAATYVNEVTPARTRGQTVLFFQMLFALGVALTGLVALWVIPNLGWRWMFGLGTVTLIFVPLLGRLLPESPRWLAGQGRITEAEAALARIEAAAAPGTPSPPLTSVALERQARPHLGIGDLLHAEYRLRTLSAWAILFCTSAVGYGIATWMPTLYRSEYGLTVAEALRYGLTNNAVGLFGVLLGALTIDRIGRRACFTIAFTGAAACLSVLSYIASTTAPAPAMVMGLSSAAFFFISVMLSGIYVYMPEIYPTRLRALGTGVATAWYRLAAIVSPLAIGFVLASRGADGVFLMLAGAAAAGAALVLLFVLEMKGRPLE